MGNKIPIESQPTLRGSNGDINIEAIPYFNRIKTFLRKSYVDNMYSDENLKMSLEYKSFKSNPTRPTDFEDITWLEYIKNYLENIIDTKHYSWCTELLFFIDKQSFLFENKYDSVFFFNDFLIKTFPESLYKNDVDNDENVIDIDALEVKYNTEPINLDELDITANLGGSYLELNVEELLPDDPTVQYQKRRKLIKKYIKIFKEHIYKNNEHPIMTLISGFIKIFCKYINTNIKTFEDDLKKGTLKGEEYNEKLVNFEKEITASLQDFISQTHCTTKLFYSAVIDYAPFQEEKDDLMNMLITLFFRTGNLYETIYNLYSLAFAKQIQDLQDKLIKLKNVKPKNLGVQVKFCLDDDTLELQQQILKEKRAEKEEKEEKEKNEKINNEKLNNEKANIGLDLIKEGEEDEKDDEEEEEKVGPLNEINTDSNKIKKEKNDESSVYLLEKINSDMFDESSNIPLYAGFAQIRNTINSFNNKKYMFPKLHNKLRDTISIKDQYIKEAKVIGKLPVPYLSAIKLLSSLKKYKAPFEKIVIIAAISDQIMESASSFWNEMEKYIKSSFLFIEADEIMTIFLFIMIKSQMPEIIIFSKMITNFTTPNTRSFNLSYNFTLLEASLEYISSLKNLKELLKNQDNKQLKDARKSLAIITNQRLSLLA
jgi:hypothetical protein